MARVGPQHHRKKKLCTIRNALSCIYLLTYLMVLLKITSVSQGARHRMSKLGKNEKETRRYFIYLFIHDLFEEALNILKPQSDGTGLERLCKESVVAEFKALSLCFCLDTLKKKNLRKISARVAYCRSEILTLDFLNMTEGQPSPNQTNLHGYPKNSKVFRIGTGQKTVDNP